MDFLKEIYGKIIVGLLIAFIGEEYLRFRPGLSEKYVSKPDYRHDLDEIKQCINDFRKDVKSDLIRIYDKIEK